RRTDRRHYFRRREEALYPRQPRRCDAHSRRDAARTGAGPALDAMIRFPAPAGIARGGHTTSEATLSRAGVNPAAIVAVRSWRTCHRAGCGFTGELDMSMHVVHSRRSGRTTHDCGLAWLTAVAVAGGMVVAAPGGGLAQTGPAATPQIVAAVPATEPS